MMGRRHNIFVPLTKEYFFKLADRYIVVYDTAKWWHESADIVHTMETIVHDRASRPLK